MWRRADLRGLKSIESMYLGRWQKENFDMAQKLSRSAERMKIVIQSVAIRKALLNEGGVGAGDIQRVGIWPAA